jgi:hypothetical protein
MRHGRMRHVRTTAALLLGTLLAACGGGGGGGSTAAAPVVVATSSAATTSATFSLTIPAAAIGTATARAAQSVSPGTKSFVIALTSVNGVASSTSIETDLTSPACAATSSGTTCTVQLVAPAGTDIFAVTLYAGTGATGAVLGSVTTPETVVANGSNRIALAVNGVIATLHLFLIASGSVIGSAQTATAYVVALDATGAEILLPGAYTAPITVTSSDSTGHVLVAVDGGTPAASVQLASPQDALTVVFNGTGNAQAVTLTAAAAGVTSATATYTVTGSPPTATPASVTFAQLGTAGMQHVTIGGGVAPYLVNGTTASSGSPAISYSVSGTQITLVANGAASQTFTISDALGETVALPVTSSTLTVPIQ